MSGIYFFIFASCESLKSISVVSSCMKSFGNLCTAYLTDLFKKRLLQITIVNLQTNVVSGSYTLYTHNYSRCIIPQRLIAYALQSYYIQCILYINVFMYISYIKVKHNHIKIKLVKKKKRTNKHVSS